MKIKSWPTNARNAPRMHVASPMQYTPSSVLHVHASMLTHLQLAAPCMMEPGICPFDHVLTFVVIFFPYVYMLLCCKAQAILGLCSMPSNTAVQYWMYTWHMAHHAAPHCFCNHSKNVPTGDGSCLHPEAYPCHGAHYRTKFVAWCSNAVLNQPLQCRCN